MSSPFEQKISKDRLFDNDQADVVLSAFSPDAELRLLFWRSVLRARDKGRPTARIERAQVISK